MKKVMEHESFEKRATTGIFYYFTQTESEEKSFRADVHLENFKFISRSMHETPLNVNKIFKAKCLISFNLKVRVLEE